MTTSSQLAKHIRGVYFGPNWSDNNLKMHLPQITWQEANQEVHGLNSIVKLAYHLHYFVVGVSDVLDGGTLDIRDKFSFDHPIMSSQEDWDIWLDEMWEAGERFATLIENLPESKLVTDFTDAKYGTYHGNILGILEHLHYHLGQIVVIRKIIEHESKTSS